MSPPTARCIPLWVKVAYTAFVAVLVPFYLRAYGPTNFLYFCDVALLLTVPALWLEWSLPASAAAVGILIPQALWMADFLAGIFGYTLTGMTAYMFQFSNAGEFFTRALSFFHFWLPILLVWLIFRLGYDRRGFVAWTVLAVPVLVVCYVWLPAPHPAASDVDVINVNYVFGFSSTRNQEWMSPDLYFVLFTLVMIFGASLPTHWLLNLVCPEPKVQSSHSA